MSIVLAIEGKKRKLTAHLYSPEIFSPILNIVKIVGKSRFLSKTRDSFALSLRLYEWDNVKVW